MLHDILQLDRPVISLDLETSGLHAAVDRILQIGIVKVYPDGRMTEWESLIDPGIDIPIEAVMVHGIDRNALKGAPAFADVAEKLYLGMKDCDFTGYNVRAFDIPFIMEEFRRCNIHFRPGRVVDAFLIYKKYNPRNLTTAIRSYLQKDHPDAHSALADARAALEVLRAQFLQHDDLPRDLNAVELLFPKNPNAVDPDAKLLWKNAEACFNFGKYPGQSLKKISSSDPGYLQWICRSNFSPELKKIITEALEGKFPVKK